jgi:hypothetical protein
VLCWGGAIAYWRSAEHGPATGDLLLALLAAPLGVLLAFWGIKKCFSSGTATAAVPAASPAAKPAAGTVPVPRLAILATALRSPHGASAEELASAIAEGKARADLDPELLDNKGFPLTAARRGDALDEAFQEELNDWLSHSEMMGLRFSEAQWRALTLGTAVMRDLASEAMSAFLPSEGAPSVLRLIPLLPEQWTVEQRTATVMWFKHLVVQLGWPPASMYCVDSAARGSAAIPEVFGQLARDTSASGSRLAALVIACDSRIDQETVDRWESNGSLFTTSRSQRLIPGEGAAGLLLTDLQHVKQIATAAYLVLEPLLDARHTVSIDDSKRTDTKVLLNLVEHACKSASVASTEIAMIVADTDDRANRMLELMGVASTVFPQLEDAAEIARVGPSSGACGVVPGITALALAHHHALERAAPVLYVSNDDAHHRCTALVRPVTSV